MKNNLFYGVVIATSATVFFGNVSVGYGWIPPGQGSSRTVRMAGPVRAQYNDGRQRVSGQYREGVDRAFRQYNDPSYGRPSVRVPYDDGRQRAADQFGRGYQKTINEYYSD